MYVPCPWPRCQSAGTPDLEAACARALWSEVPLWGVGGLVAARGGAGDSPEHTAHTAPLAHPSEAGRIHSSKVLSDCIMQPPSPLFKCPLIFGRLYYITHHHSEIDFGTVKSLL